MLRVVALHAVLVAHTGYASLHAAAQARVVDIIVLALQAFALQAVVGYPAAVVAFLARSPRHHFAEPGHTVGFGWLGLLKPLFAETAEFLSGLLPCFVVGTLSAQEVVVNGQVGALLAVEGTLDALALEYGAPCRTNTLRFRCVLHEALLALAGPVPKLPIGEAATVEAPAPLIAVLALIRTAVPRHMVPLVVAGQAGAVAVRGLVSVKLASRPAAPADRVPRV